MTILFMRASFGKLKHHTLTLKEGLNLIEAPNEWGKSTWCAFLIAMLYGIDTKSKSSKSQLSDKERFTPWSGAPMEGRMDLIWKGRHITIERSTKGRIPMGTFRAFETETGLDIPELTAENCGQMLLGVEREVFARSGFVRFSDLAVTDQEHLRNRLNALVTTGDETGSGQQLEQKLKELKHRCRYNRTGLLPQAYEQRQQLQESMQQHLGLTQQEEKLTKRISELEEHLAQLENHKAALQFASAQPDQEQLHQALEDLERAKTQLEDLEAQCQECPSAEEAYHRLQQLNQMQLTMDSIELEEAMMPTPVSAPEPPAGFEGCTPQNAIIQALAHQKELSAMDQPRSPMIPGLLGLGAVLLAAAACLFFLDLSWFVLPLALGAGSLAAGIALALLRRKSLSKCRLRQLTLVRKYGSSSPEQWVADARAYAKAWSDYQRRQEGCQRLRGNLDSRKQSALDDAMNASDSKGLRTALKYWDGIRALWEAYADAQRQYLQKKKQLEQLQSTPSATPPQMPDTMNFTMDETNRLLSDTNHELRQLLSRLGQCRGQLQSLDGNSELQQQYQAVQTRIQRLEDTYQALEYAQKALEEATRQLQQRFAPRITKSTREMFSQFTGGKYDRVQISQDLSMDAAAQDEDVLRSQLWRSDGTADQLYLALRLAVADELIPYGPIILDDALVRFDDQRLKETLKLLKAQAPQHQVLLFTCQSREGHLLEKL